MCVGGQQLEQQVLVRSESLSLCVCVGGAGVGEKSIPRLPLPQAAESPGQGHLGWAGLVLGQLPGQTSPAAFP